jgi:outer membrane protein TolC
MARGGLRPWIGQLGSRWQRRGLLAAGLPLLGIACTGPANYVNLPPRSDALLAQVASGSSAQHAEHSPDSTDKLQLTRYNTNAPALVPAAVAPGQPLPIDLATVFRLAEEQNPQIAQARHRLHQSMLEGASGLAAWLPKITAGPAYYRHEGGIQNPDGTFVKSSFGALYPGVDLRSEINLSEQIYNRVNAERQQWQQKSDISKVTSDILLDAATTYLDLLTARRATAVAEDLESKVEVLLKRADDMRKVDQSATIIYEGVKAEVAGRQQMILKLKQQGDAAAAKLAYLLCLPCDQPLVPVEATLAPIDLVDASVPLDKLVAVALDNGPGVRELQGLLATIQAGAAKLEGPISLLPTIQANVWEGSFSAGQGGSLNTDNRFDVGLQARWDITGFLSAHQKHALSQSKMLEVALAQKELRGKLTFGVQEAQLAIQAGKQEITLGTDQIQRASKVYGLSDQRMKEHVLGANISEVLQAIRGLESAHQNYLTAINDHNKAQVRLMMLLGPNNVHADGPAK